MGRIFTFVLHLFYWVIHGFQTVLLKTMAVIQKVWISETVVNVWNSSRVLWDMEWVHSGICEVGLFYALTSVYGSHPDKWISRAPVVERLAIELGTWISNYIHITIQFIIIHSCLNFNRSWAKPLLKLWQGWVMISQRKLGAIAHPCLSLQGPHLLTWIKFHPNIDMQLHPLYRVWDEITYPFPNFNGTTVEAWEWISNSILHFNGHVITYPGWDQS